MPYPNTIGWSDIVIQTPAVKLRRSRLFWVPETPPTTAEHMTIICNAVHVKFSNLLKVMMPNDCRILGVDGRYISTGGGGVDLESNSSLGPVAGLVPGADEDSAQGLPDEVTLMIGRFTGKGGRAKKGRLFFSGMAEVIQDGGVLEDDFIDAGKDLANAVPEDLVVESEDPEFATTLHMRHWDRKNNVLEPIVLGKLCLTMTSRRDRRKPLEIAYLAQAVGG